MRYRTAWVKGRMFPGAPASRPIHRKRLIAELVDNVKAAFRARALIAGLGVR